MSQESYTMPEPKIPHEVPNGTNTASKTHGYSSSVNQGLRHYASPEESEAVFPVFSTPTHMYIVQELNGQPRGPPQYTASPNMPAHYSPTQQQKQTYSGTSNTYQDPAHTTPGSPLAQQQTYGRTRDESSPVRPSMETADSTPSVRNNYTASPSTPSALPQKDFLLAQLIDMGFSLEASQVAMAASGGDSLQEILDILVQNVNTPPHRPTPTPQSRSARDTYVPPPTNNYTAPPTRDSYTATPPKRDSYTAAPPKRDSYTTPKPKIDSYTTPQPNRDTYTPPPSTDKYPSNGPSVPPPSTRPMPPRDEHVKSDDEDEREQEERFKRDQEERRREYLDQIKREKPIPPMPSPRPPQPAPPVSEPISLFADHERKQGNYLFNKGQYEEAESAYSVAINALPAGHNELVLLFNNRAAARLKMRKYQDCITDCALAIEIARVQMSYGSDVTWKAQMIKALHRKASALEGLCLFEKAIQVYEEYIQLDGARSEQVSQGILRCQQALLEKRQPPPQPPRPAPNWKPANESSAFPDIDFNMFIPQQTAQQKANLEEINKSKAVKEMRDRERKKESEDAERLMKQDIVDAKISVWKMGKDRNLRALLGSLEMILWPGVQWKGVTMGELIEPRKCKITYMKAIAKVHPDKLPANATVEQRMLASGIFTTLNQAWDIFKVENRL